MSIFSVPAVADRVGRILSSVSERAPKPKPRGGPATQSVPTDTAHVSTRHGEVRCTVYRPGEPSNAPVYVNIHGGGFVIGFPEQDDAWCRFLAAEVGVTVVNIDYATAPRHPFPIALEQCVDVVSWAASSARDWDGSRLCVGGQSAGGNLSTGVARLARDAGSPTIALQVLNYPVLDMATPPSDKPTTNGRVPPGWMGEVFNHCYVPDPAQRQDPLVSPAWGDNDSDLAGIAPALVITCERDKLRAEGQRYAAKLRTAGALVDHLDIAGVDHGYDVRGKSPEIIEQTWQTIGRHVAELTKPS